MFVTRSEDLYVTTSQKNSCYPFPFQINILKVEKVDVLFIRFRNVIKFLPVRHIFQAALGKPEKNS